MGTRVIENFKCDLSLLNGNAFIANPSDNISMHGTRSKFTLAVGGKTLIGYGISPGTVEVLFLEILASPAFDNNTGWSFFGGAVEISGGKFYIWGDSSFGYLTDVNALTVGALYKTIPVVSRNTATYMGIEFGTHVIQSTGITSAIVYGTAIGNGYFKYSQAGAGNIDIDSSTLKRVLAPGPTGVTIGEELKGAPNWTSNDGIDASVVKATGCTLTIETFPSLSRRWRRCLW